MNENIKNDCSDFISEIKTVYKERTYLLRRLYKNNQLLYSTFPKFSNCFYRSNISDQYYTYKIIVSLYSYNPNDSSEDISLGKACRNYMNEVSSDTLKNMFIRLTNINSREDIYNQNILMKFMVLFNNKGIHINYATLFNDLWYWGDNVKERWIRDFYIIDTD